MCASTMREGSRTVLCLRWAVGSLTVLCVGRAKQQPSSICFSDRGTPLNDGRSLLFIEQSDQWFLSDLALFQFNYAAQAPLFKLPSALIMQPCVDLVTAVTRRGHLLATFE